MELSPRSSGTITEKVRTEVAKRSQRDTDRQQSHFDSVLTGDDDNTSPEAATAVEQDNRVCGNSRSTNDTTTA